MRIHFITHALFEAPGFFESWAKQQAFDVGVTELFRDQPLPSLEQFDVLITMGGPQSAAKYRDCPYLSKEITFLRQVVDTKKKIIGVCLGAQLLSVAFGADVVASPHKEIGFFPITLTEAGERHPCFQQLPVEMVVGHWHSDMPGLPNGAAVLAKSQGCPRQIIQFTPQIYGFQCHLELTPTLLQLLISNCGSDLTNGMYIQSKQEMLDGNFEQTSAYLSSFLDHFIFL